METHIKELVMQLTALQTDNKSKDEKIILLKKEATDTEKNYDVRFFFSLKKAFYFIYLFILSACIAHVKYASIFWFNFFQHLVLLRTFVLVKYPINVRILQKAEIYIFKSSILGS